MSTPRYDWRSIVALNAVSTLAQVGQFGVPFIVLPLWLEQQGATTLQLSLFASSLWLGQLPGLFFAPRMTQWLGAKRVILIALMMTMLALSALVPKLPALWMFAGALAGFGQGLRWIGLEPWLYDIAPSHARGRLVGFHESLIALAPIVAPALCGWLGIGGNIPLFVGMAFLLLAALPLGLATERPSAHALAVPARASSQWLLYFPKETVFLVGICVALFGGMSESAFAGLFAIYGRAHELEALDIASLLISFGVGGVMLQYVAGWLADHRSVGFACLCCSVTAVAVSILMTLHLSMLLLHVAVFVLGGVVTAYLTLAIVASAKTPGGSMAHTMSAISMAYTLTAIAGPLLAGSAIENLGGNGLMWTLAGFGILMSVSLVGILGAAARRSSPTQAR